MKERLEACLGLKVHPEIGESVIAPTGEKYRSFLGCWASEGEFAATAQIAWLDFVAEVASLAHTVADVDGEPVLYWRELPHLIDIIAEASDAYPADAASIRKAGERYAISARLLISAKPVLSAEELALVERNPRTLETMWRVKTVTREPRCTHGFGMSDTCLECFDVFRLPGIRVIAEE